MIGLNAQHVRIRMWVTALPVRNIPKSLANLSADQQFWVQIDLISVRQGNKKIDSPEGVGIVIARARLNPRPYEIEANGVEAEFMHARKISFDRFWIPFCGPLHRFDRWHPVCPDRDKTMTVAGKVIPVQSHRRKMGRRLRGCRRSALPRRTLRCLRKCRRKERA